MVRNFIVKNICGKSKYSCEHVIYFNLDSEIIKENCNFVYYFNIINIKPTVLDGGNEIMQANWPNDKHIKYKTNNDIPVRIPSFPYVLLNRSVLCNYKIEAENNFLFWNHRQHIKNCNYVLTRYFTVSLAFVNNFDNLTKSLEFPCCCCCE